MRMLGRLLGVPDDDGPWLVERGDALLGNLDPEFTEHPVGLTDTDEFSHIPFRSPAALDLYRYAERAGRAAAVAPDRRRDHRPARADDRRRAADRARVQELLRPARQRRQRHHPLHDDGRLEGPDRAPGPARRAAQLDRRRPRGDGPRRRGDPPLGHGDDALPADRDAGRRAPRRARSRTGRQGGDLVRLGRLRRRAVPRAVPVRHPADARTTTWRSDG